MEQDATQVQVFLPFPSFTHSLEVLDRARLGKQRVECLQLIGALRAGGGWVNHPAALMWRGYVPALGVYMTLCIQEWQRRGYANNMILPYDEAWQPNPHFAAHEMLLPLHEVETPPWLGDPAFHASHRSNLLRKMPDYYGSLGWQESPDLPYVWPVQKAAAA